MCRFGFSEQEVAKGFDTALRSAETKAIKVGLQAAEDVCARDCRSKVAYMNRHQLDPACR